MIEVYANTYGVSIKRYCTDKRRFLDNFWRQDVLEKRHMTFSGFSTHHQNGRVEQLLRDLQDMSRSSLLHAHRNWPNAVNKHLWPYVIRYENKGINRLPFRGNDLTPLEMFRGVKDIPNVREVHPFGGPAYVLNSELQGHQKNSKMGPASSSGYLS
jgi:hypothetical protein